MIAHALAATLGLPRLDSGEAASTIRITRWRQGDAAFEVPPVPEVAVVVALTDAFAVERSVGRHKDRGVARLGGVSVVPPGRTGRFRIRGASDVLQVHLSETLLADAAACHARTPHGAVPDLVPLFFVSDPAVERTAYTLLRELQTKAPDPMALEGCGMWLASHLVSAHAISGSLAQPRRLGGLAPRRLRAALDLVEAAPARPLRIAELAAVAGLSSFHFVREFRRETGVTPWRHVIRRRVDVAKALLLHRSPPLSLADVAALSGFSSPVHLARQFRRELGVAPGAWRRMLA